MFSPSRHSLGALLSGSSAARDSSPATHSSRRSFLGASIAGLASTSVFGADSVSTLFDDAAFQPSTLFLTWQRDPTTTMTVQWVGTVGETSDTTVRYWPDKSFTWLEPSKSEKPKIKPYPLTDFKVFRAELTGLKPGTDSRE